jgi:hypothetical protein
VRDEDTKQKFLKSKQFFLTRTVLSRNVENGAMNEERKNWSDEARIKAKNKACKKGEKWRIEK